MLRNASAADLARIEEIEAASFAEPWDAAAFCGAFEAEPVNVIVSDNGGVDGFIIFSLIAGEAEVYDIAVAPESRCRGIGRALMGEMLRRAETAFLEVREGNSAALALYKRCGFAPIGLRKAYYQNGENAVVMTAEGELKHGADTGN